MSLARDCKHWKDGWRVRLKHTVVAHSRNFRFVVESLKAVEIEACKKEVSKMKEQIASHS